MGADNERARRKIVFTAQAVQVTIRSRSTTDFSRASSRGRPTCTFKLSRIRGINTWAKTAPRELARLKSVVERERIVTGTACAVKNNFTPCAFVVCAHQLTS